MASLIFDPTRKNKKSLILIGHDGKELGCWFATNRPDSHAALNYIPDGDYAFYHEDRRRSCPHPRESDDKGIPVDSLNGKFGTYGIFRLLPVNRQGVQIGHPEEPLGIHSGRFFAPDGFGRRGPFHATAGCIRTSEDAMREINKAVASDPLTVLIIRNRGSVLGAAK